MSRIRVCIVSVLLISLLFSACSSEKNTNDEVVEDKGIDYEYTNNKGQKFAFHCNDSRAVIFEKGVDELINEWTDNVALAEKTYGEPNVIVITEGYIQSINKGTNDGYYLLISENEDGSFLSTDELRVYFRKSSVQDSLLKVKKGQYITLVCSAHDTTFFLEYPELEAVYVLEPLSVAEDDNGISTMIGLTVSDIVSQYGLDYEVNGWQGATYFTYKDCPYDFFYSTVEYDSDWQPNSDDRIWGIEVYKEGVAVTDKIKIGDTIQSIESVLGKELVIEEGVTDTIINGVEYTFAFEMGTGNLVSAGCWGEFIPPAHPDIIKDKLDLLEFAAYTDDIDFIKKEFILCIIQNDISTYFTGGKSGFDWSKDRVDVETNWEGYWKRLIDDLGAYMSGETCNYEEQWIAGEKLFYQFASGEMGVGTESMAEAVNYCYHRLGTL